MLVPDERRGRHGTGPGRVGGFAQLVVRLAVAALLVGLAYDKVLAPDRLADYSAQLATGPLPAPIAGAVLVYGQFVAGVGIALGLLVRPLALLTVVLAVGSLLMTTSGGVFAVWIAPLATLAGAAFLMLNGAGRLSLDGVRSGR